MRKSLFANQNYLKELRNPHESKKKHDSVLSNQIQKNISCCNKTFRIATSNLHSLHADLPVYNLEIFFQVLKFHKMHTDYILFFFNFPVHLIMFQTVTPESKKVPFLIIKKKRIIIKIIIMTWYNQPALKILTLFFLNIFGQH